MPALGAMTGGQAVRRSGQARDLLADLLVERTCPQFRALPAYRRYLA